MTQEQPEALRLAEILEGDYCPDWFYEQGVDEVYAELRRLHAENEALRKDAERMDWLLWKLPGDALRHVVFELSDTSSGAEFRAAIDAAMKGQS